MTGDHHGQSIERATLLVRAVDAILGTHTFEPGKTVRFPKGTCAVCLLRTSCTTSGYGRSVAIHPDEALLTELRKRQATPDGRARLRERTKVEHGLAHAGHWQGRQARYRGTRKNLPRHPQEPIRPAPHPPLSTTSTSSPASQPPPATCSS